MESFGQSRAVILSGEVRGPGVQSYVILEISRVLSETKQSVKVSLGAACLSRRNRVLGSIKVFGQSLKVSLAAVRLVNQNLKVSLGVGSLAMFPNMSHSKSAGEVEKVGVTGVEGGRQVSLFREKVVCVAPHDDSSSICREAE